MPLIIPNEVLQFRDASVKASHEVETTGKTWKDRWTLEQARELGRIYEIVMSTHKALYAVIDANQDE